MCSIWLQIIAIIFAFLGAGMTSGFRSGDSCSREAADAEESSHGISFIQTHLDLSSGRRSARADIDAPAPDACSNVLPFLAKKFPEDDLERFCHYSFPAAACDEARSSLASQPWHKDAVSRACEQLGNDDWHKRLGMGSADSVKLALLLHRRTRTQATDRVALARQLDGALLLKEAEETQPYVEEPPYSELPTAPPPEEVGTQCMNVSQVELGDNYTVTVFEPIENCTVTTSTTTTTTVTTTSTTTVTTTGMTTDTTTVTTTGTTIVTAADTTTV
jgi:hypothetical protein